MENQETIEKAPCWEQKRCNINGCSAMGKNVDCWDHPNAGYIGKFCNGPMRPEFKKARCSGCPVFLNRTK